MTLNKGKVKKYGFVWSVLAYPMVLFVIFYLVVNFNSIIMAFQDRTFTGSVKGWVGFKHFSEFIKNISNSPIISVSLSNSLKMYLAGLLISMPLQLLFSYFLFKKFAGHSIVRFIVLLPAIISEFIICLVFKKFVEGAMPIMLKDIFNLKTFPNIITNVKYTYSTVLFYTVWMSFTTSLVMYPNAMNQIPDEVIESGMIDGVQPGLQELWYLVLPLIFPTISTFLITGFGAILTATGPLVAFFMLNAPQPAFTMGYFYYVEVAGSSSQISYPYLAAGGLIMTLVVAPLTFLLKWLLEKHGPSTEY